MMQTPINASASIGARSFGSRQIHERVVLNTPAWTPSLPPLPILNLLSPSLQDLKLTNCLEHRSC